MMVRFISVFFFFLTITQKCLEFLKRWKRVFQTIKPKNSFISYLYAITFYITIFWTHIFSYKNLFLNLRELVHLIYKLHVCVPWSPYTSRACACIRYTCVCQKKSCASNNVPIKKSCMKSNRVWKVIRKVVWELFESFLLRVSWF